VLGAVVVASDQAASDLAVVGVLAVLVEVARAGVESLDGRGAGGRNYAISRKAQRMERCKE
jgi:hypothetical protein